MSSEDISIEVLESEIERLTKILREKKAEKAAMATEEKKPFCKLNPVEVSAKELDTGRITEYKSFSLASKDLGINTGLIKMCCDGTNRVKSGFSKKNGKRYTFSYASF